MDEAERKNLKKEQVTAKLQESQAAAREVAKDAALLSQHARVLKAKAMETRATAQKLRAAINSHAPPVDSTENLFTVAEACSLVGICESTMRHVLREPELRQRLVERNRRVGIFYKFVTLLPPDLVMDLTVRYAAKNPPIKD